MHAANLRIQDRGLAAETHRADAHLVGFAGQALFQLGLIEEKRHNNDRAIDLYAKAFSINPALMAVQGRQRIEPMRLDAILRGRLGASGVTVAGGASVEASCQLLASACGQRWSGVVRRWRTGTRASSAVRDSRPSAATTRSSAASATTG